MMTQSDQIKLLAVVEAATVTGPARNLLDFFASADAPREKGEPYLSPTLTTYHRSRIALDPNEVPNEFVRRARAQNIPVDVIAERFPFDLRVVNGLRDAVLRRAPDIVETHHVKSHFLFRLSGAWQRRPWIAFHHGYTSTDAKVRLYNHLDRWSLRAAHRVITVSQAFARDLKAIGVPEQRILVLHNSIAPSWFDSVRAHDKKFWREQLKISDGERVILAVGRFSKEKALADLVTAFAQLSRAQPQLKARLILVGDGLERGPVQQLAAELGATQHILFAGQVSDPRPYYAAADILAMPSLSEGSPLALLEAMAAGLPIVATRVGGVPEIVRHEQDALLVAPSQPDALAQAINLLLADENLARRLGEAAQNTVSTRFTPDAHRTTRLEFYRELLAENVRTP